MMKRGIRAVLASGKEVGVLIFQARDISGHEKVVWYLDRGQVYIDVIIFQSSLNSALKICSFNDM